MRDFFVSKDLLLFSNNMRMNSDFSVRGFSGGLSEATGTLTVSVIAAGDPYWTNVVLLIQPPDDTIDGSTTIADRSQAGTELTIFGNTQVDTSLGYPVVLCDGAGDYVTIPSDNTSIDISGAMTLEALVSTTSTKSSNVLISTRRTGYAVGYQFSLGSGVPSLTCWCIGGSVELITGGVAVNDGSLHHIEFSIAEDRTVRLYVDGQFVTSLTLPSWTSVTSYTKYLYRDPTNTSRDFAGSSRLRITNGIARHVTTDAFTPPTKFEVV